MVDRSLKLVSNATRGVGYLLRNKHEVFFQIQSFNKGRHYLFSPPSTRSEVPKYYVLFKTAFLQSFNSLFPDFVSDHSEFSGFGESINEEFLETALLFKVDFLLFVYDDGKVYGVSPKAVKLFCEKYGLFRFQDKCNTYKTGRGVVSVREKTYSFPVVLLERFGDV